MRCKIFKHKIRKYVFVINLTLYMCWNFHNVDRHRHHCDIICKLFNNTIC